MFEPEVFTPAEQRANSFSHLFGVFLSLYAIFVLATDSKTVTQIAATTIFGVSLFLMFLASVLYHSVTNINLVKFFQKIDHSAIYILIAGTYTPCLLFTLKFPLNVILLGIIWALAIMGIIFICTSLESKAISTGLYLLMGWISLMLVYNVWVLSPLAVWLLFAGGVFYSIGCIFYLSKFRYTHCIWHLFVLAGAAAHYFAILELLKIINQI